MLTGLGAAARDLGALQPVLTARDAVRDQLSRRLVPGRGELLLAALIGGASGLAINLLSQDSPSTASTSFVLMFLLFALLGIQALITVRQSSVFSDVGAHHVRLNLLDLTPLTTFARNGARNAGYWLLGSAMASLLFASSTTPWIVALVLFATVGIGVLGMLLPSRGLHLRIRACKRQELSRVRAEAEREVARLFSTETNSANGGRLPSLLAYEARIHAVREWPFDTATLGRFLLFLVIPLTSWIGGALVERGVNAALE